MVTVDERNASLFNHIARDLISSNLSKITQAIFRLHNFAATCINLNEKFT